MGRVKIYFAGETVTPGVFWMKVHMVLLDLGRPKISFLVEKHDAFIDFGRPNSRNNGQETGGDLVEKKTCLIYCSTSKLAF